MNAPRTVYRVVQTERPTEDDFLSATAKGRRPSRNTAPERLRLWDGVSVYDSDELARQTARTFPSLGWYIAMLQIPEDGSVRWEKTLGRGHYTLWADPAQLLACVIQVTAV